MPSKELDLICRKQMKTINILVKYQFLPPPHLQQSRLQQLPLVLWIIIAHLLIVFSPLLTPPAQQSKIFIFMLQNYFCSLFKIISPDNPNYFETQCSLAFKAQHCERMLLSWWADLSNAIHSIHPAFVVKFSLWTPEL